MLLIWDGLPSHRSRRMRDWVASQRHWLSVEPLPGYAPELNPIEQVWGNLKSKELANLCSDTIGDVADIAEDGLDRIGSDASLCFAFLHHCGLRLYDPRFTGNYAILFKSRLAQPSEDRGTFSTPGGRSTYGAEVTALRTLLDQAAAAQTNSAEVGLRSVMCAPRSIAVVDRFRPTPIVDKAAYCRSHLLLFGCQ